MKLAKIEIGKEQGQGPKICIAKGFQSQVCSSCYHSTVVLGEVLELLSRGWSFQRRVYCWG
jgi:hypothetical protein